MGKNSSALHYKEGIETRGGHDRGWEIRRMVNRRDAGDGSDETPTYVHLQLS